MRPLESHDKATVDLGVTREVLRDGLRADVLHPEVGKRGGVEFEAREVGRKNQPTSRPQEIHGPSNHAHMVALHIEHAVHALGVGEGGRVDENKIEPWSPHRLTLHPLQTIGTKEFMFVAAEAVEQQILPRPLEIGAGQIHARRAAGAAGGRVYGGAARVAEQIEEIRIPGPLTQHPPSDAVVEK